MARGGCRLTSDHSSIDARFEARVALGMSGLLGDERVERRERRHTGARRMSGARELRAQRAPALGERMTRQVTRAQQLPSPPVEGSLTRMVGLDARGLRLPGRGRRRLRPDERRRLASRGRGRRLRGRQTISHAHGRSARTRARGARHPAPARGQRARRSRDCSAASSTATGAPLDGLGPIRATNASNYWGRPSIRWRVIRSTRRSMSACVRSTRC